MFNLVVSNVPGPQQTFYLDGVPLLEVFPAVPLNPRNQALTIGIVSYDGGVRFGLLADRDALPDVDEAADGVAGGRPGAGGRQCRLRTGARCQSSVLRIAPSSDSRAPSLVRMRGFEPPRP